MAVGIVIKVLVAACVIVAIFLIVAFARSMRGGSSGSIGSALALTLVPLVIADLWVLALVIGWWTIAAFVIVSILVGMVVLRPTLPWWVVQQPLVGALAIFLTERIPPFDDANEVEVGLNLAVEADGSTKVAVDE